MHPWSLFALFVLACNDHWLKGLGPAWITGKLSDFAGLFYFPFLVILLVAQSPGLRDSRFGLPLGRFVFWAVGIWFATAKTIPIVHTATVRFAEVLVGEVQIALDPSDAYAIVVLIPAWYLYKHVAAASSLRFSKRIQPVVIATAILLTAATSKPFTPSANRLVVHEDRLYVVVGDETDRDGKSFSTLDGVHWDAAKLPDSVIRSHQRQTILGHEASIVRLVGRKILVDDHDSWSISNARQDFMVVAGAEPWKALDVALVPQSPEIIVVALGTEGIVVRTRDGPWTRHGIGEAQPTPDRVSVRESATLILRGQWLFGAAATLLAWGLMSLLTWCSSPNGVLPFARAKVTPGTPLTRFRNTPRNAYRTFTRLRFESRYVLIAVAGCIAPAITFLSHLAPFSARKGLMPPLLFAGFFLTLSLIIIALGWRHYRKTNAGNTTPNPLPTAVLAGITAIGTLMLWDLGWLGSMTWVFLISACSVLGLVTIRAAKSKQ